MNGCGCVFSVAILFSLTHTCNASLICEFAAKTNTTTTSHHPSLPPSKLQQQLDHILHRHQQHHHGDIKREMVVSRCDENVSWLVQEAKYFDRISLYNKCETEVEREALEIPQLVVIAMPNIGSADGAYLRHITTRYHHLARSITFTKAYPKRCLPSVSLESLLLLQSSSSSSSSSSSTTSPLSTSFSSSSYSFSMTLRHSYLPLPYHHITITIRHQTLQRSIHLKHRLP